MKRFSALTLAMALSFAAFAQQYRWVDENGRVQYGDTPPPGVKATPLRAPATPPAAAAPAAGTKSGKALTPSEQEAEYRKRQLEARKAADKAAAVDRDSTQNKENCARAQEYLRGLESGQRQARVDSAGERYFLDDAQVAQETAKTRQAVQQLCSGGG